MNLLLDELNEVSSRCLTLIEVYMRECKANDVPVYLDYFRVHKELYKAKKVL